MASIQTNESLSTTLSQRYDTILWLKWPYTMRHIVQSAYRCRLDQVELTVFASVKYNYHANSHPHTLLILTYINGAKRMRVDPLPHHGKHDRSQRSRVVLIFHRHCVFGHALNRLRSYTSLAHDPPRLHPSLAFDFHGASGFQPVPDSLQ